jgi:hypothetical protein
MDMAGAVYFIALIAVLVLVGVGIATPFLLIPAVVIGLGLLAVPAFGAVLRRTSVGQPQPGPDVPTTREASYDPVHTPEPHRQ